MLHLANGKIKKDVPQIQLLPSVRLASAHALILKLIMLSSTWLQQ